MEILDYILWPFGWIIRSVYNLGGSYLLALFAFAIVMKIILLPFGIKQQKNQIRQARLKPKEMAIKNKYAGRNDKATRDKAQQEVLDMYQREKFSPLSGCLPLLVQMPIILVLYQIIRNPLTYISELSTGAVNKIIEVLNTTPLLNQLKEAGLATAELSSKTYQSVITNCLHFFRDAGGDAWNTIVDGVASLPSGGADLNAVNLAQFKEFGFLDLSMTPSAAMSAGGINWLLMLIPVLTFVVSYFSMKLTKKFTLQDPAMANQPGSKVMDFSMPLISVFFTFIIEGFIGVYWMYQNLLSLLQTFILAKLMPLPKYTDEDVKAAEREMYGKAPKSKKTIASAYGYSSERPRSLHFIDAEEDDEDESAPSPAAKNTAESLGAPKLKDDDHSKTEYKKK